MMTKGSRPLSQICKSLVLNHEKFSSNLTWESENNPLRIVSYNVNGWSLYLDSRTSQVTSGSALKCLVGSSYSKSRSGTHMWKQELELKTADGQIIFIKPSFWFLCPGSMTSRRSLTPRHVRQRCWIGCTLTANSHLMRLAPGSRVFSHVLML